MEHRFRALRTIGSIFTVVGYIILALTVLAALAICGLSVIGGSVYQSTAQQLGINSGGAGLLGGLFGGLLLGIFTILYGGLIAITFVAFGEGLYLLLSIEENTRRTTYLIENQTKLPPVESKAVTPSPANPLPPGEPVP